MMIYDAEDKNHGLMICWAPEKDNYKHHPLGFIHLLFIFLGICVFIYLFIYLFIIAEAHLYSSI